MKPIIFTAIFLILTSCGQSHPEQKNEHKISADTDTVEMGLKNDEAGPNAVGNLPEQTDYQNLVLSHEFKNVTLFKLTDTIKADFNGDGHVDYAVFRSENETSGILIKHGQTNEAIRIGFGEPFAHLTEFNWVDFWGLVNDMKTYEVVIEAGEIIGDRAVNLENPSIVVRREEEGGGLIVFRNGKYEWIHQAD
jgi:hypothetical protein